MLTDSTATETVSNFCGK